MKVSVEKLPTSEAVLEVELTWDEMEKASDKAYRKLVQKVDIQGFRRGKAPRSIVERRLGKEYIYQEGLDDLMTEAYRNALKENEITPITQPTVDAPTFDMGQPYHFSIKVPVVTPPELGDYRSLHFEREEATVTSEEVDKELDQLRERAAAWEAVERPAAYGDRVTVDLKLTSGEQSISDLKDNPFELAEDRVGLFTGMDEHLLGMQVDESKNFSTTIPEDYTNEKLAGKQADYEVTLHKIEEKHLPEMDDAFAEKVSDGQYENMEDLSKALSDNILENKKRTIRDELRERVVNAVIEQGTFTIHPLLIEEQAEDMLHQFTHMLEQQQLSLDQFLMMTRKTREEYLQELHPDAEKSVKRQLVLDEVARKEEIVVGVEEVENLYALYAQAGQALPQGEEQTRALASSLRREKTISRLVELTTDPDPESEVTETVQAEDANEESAKAAALASEAHNETMETEESAKATPLPSESTAGTVE